MRPPVSCRSRFRLASDRIHRERLAQSFTTARESGKAKPRRCVSRARQRHRHIAEGGQRGFQVFGDFLLQHVWRLQIVALVQAVCLVPSDGQTGPAARHPELATEECRQAGHGNSVGCMPDEFLRS